jgi:hypothetical protein
LAAAVAVPQVEVAAAEAVVAGKKFIISYIPKEII